MFDLYLRPYEVLLVRAKDCLPPTSSFKCWSVIICPLEGGEAI